MAGVTGSYSGIFAPVTPSVACDGIDSATKRSRHYLYPISISYERFSVLVGRTFDRIAAGNNHNGFSCNSVCGESAEHVLRQRAAGVPQKLPKQICTCRAS